MDEHRLMGLDIGERRVGVAVSDPMGWTAQPEDVLDRKGGDKAVLARLRALCEEREVSLIVYGLPLNMDGSAGPAVEAVERFAKKVSEATRLPLEPWDERLSTVAAERMLIDGGVRRDKRRDVRDKVAATLILQSYLDSKAGSGFGSGR